MVQLLPPDIDEQIARAVQLFWATRSGGNGAQGGARANVIAGKNLDGFLSIVRSITEHCGIPASAVFTTGRTNLTLPGYYRASKTWDVVIIHERRLLAVLELKSQVGSFGNNFNNRTEEALGVATDLKAAQEHRLFHPDNHTLATVEAAGDVVAQDPRPPFTAYMILLEDSPESRRAVRISSPHYAPLSEFEETSYADRYRVLCEKLMNRSLYSAASLIVSPQSDGSTPCVWRSLSPATNVRSLFASLAGHLAASRESVR